MKHILLIETGNNLWKEFYSGGYTIDSYDKCLIKARELSNTTWMIVAIECTHGC